MANTQPTTSTTPSLTLLSSLPHPSGQTRTWSSSAHPSKPLLATASADKSVHVYSLTQFRLLSSITGGHKRSVRCVGWKDHGDPNTEDRRAKKMKLDTTDQNEDDVNRAQRTTPTVLATGSFDANVGIWIHNQNHDKRIAEGETRSNGDDVDDGTVAGDEDEDEEWHFSTLLTGPDSEIKSLAFSPTHYGANLLATSSRDKSVWVWEEVEEDEWETVAVLQEHAGDVKCVAWCAGARQIRKKQRNGEDDGRMEVDGGRDTTAAGTEEEDDEEIIIGSREILASGSYDDTIRLWRDVEDEGDWICVAVITGHEGTVWSVCWEGHVNSSDPDIEIYGGCRKWEPRLASSSDDLSIRIWRRHVSQAERERDAGSTSTTTTRKLPSIIRPPSSMETWEEDAVLPAVHVRSVYAIDWSRRTGLLVSCAGDGLIVVYREEELSKHHREQSGTDQAVVMQGSNPVVERDTNDHERNDQSDRSKWQVVAMFEAAHDEFEINHVCWAKRWDQGRKSVDDAGNDEEVIISTGDDGVVRIWTLPEGCL